MKQGLYSVFDNVALKFSPPFMSPNDGTAQRMLIQMLQQKSQLNDFPNNFELMHIGSMDDSVGVVSPEPLKLICGVQQCLQLSGSAPELKVASNGG